MTTPEEKTNAVIDEFVFQNNVSGSVDGNEIDLLSSVNDYTIYVKIGAGVTSGNVHIETANRPGFAGDWAILATVNVASSSDSQVAVQLTGRFRALRTRLASISGGTIRTTGQGA